MCSNCEQREMDMESNVIAMRVGRASVMVHRTMRVAMVQRKKWWWWW